jgi:membrane protein YdbS with pleckstrin-like domain
MLCPSCHSDAPAGAAFCPKCGQPLGNAAASTPLQGVPPTAADKLRAAGAATQGPPEPEQELWHGSYSSKAAYGGWLLALALTLAGIALAVLVPNPAAWMAAVVIVPVIWLAQLVTVFYRRLSVDYRLTSQRFLHKRGLLRRVSDQILLVDIDDVQYVQGLMDRAFNVGTITITSNDASDPTLRLIGIEDVERITNLIDHARREERRKRAIYMASA